MVVFDGHYWLEINGKVVEDNIWNGPIIDKRFNVCGGFKYYKPADEKTQKIAIEMMYRLNEKKIGYSRNDFMFMSIINEYGIQINKCHRNVLILLDKYPEGKIVFGSCGFKYPNGINRRTDFCDMLPKNAVWWIYGFGTYTNINQFILREQKPIEEYITIEK